MGCFGVTATHLKWLADVTRANVVLETVTNMCPISIYTVYYWLLIFLMMSLISAVVLVVLPYGLALYAYVYRYWHGLKDKPTDDRGWSNYLYLFANIFRYIGRVYNGYEIEGLDNIPAEGAALLICYHGPSQYDMVLMAAEVYLSRTRMLRAVVHRIAFKIPGMQLCLRVFQHIPGSRETCAQILKDGELLLIAPGGAYEATYSDHYQLMWRNQLGYAKVAIEARCPIIPAFTVNTRECYVCKSIFGKKWGDIVYDKWNVSCGLPIGWFPVKLRTIVGQPIPFDPALTAEELNQKIMMAMEQLITDNQRIPGSISKAILDRFKRRNIVVKQV